MMPLSMAVGMAAAAVAMMVVATSPGIAGEIGKKRVPVIFNFGDSNSDTGGLASGYGYIFMLPSGRVFFKEATGRVCDGRLVVDFLCDEVNTSSFLRPYLDSLGTDDYNNGANFAVGGAAILPKNAPFSLYIQSLQYNRFRNRLLNLTAEGWKNLTHRKGFNDAVYMFDIGQNDLQAAIYANKTYPQILAIIPSLVAEFKEAILNIYVQGGRKFWIHNTGPLGCMPEKLVKYHKDPSDLDQAGCLVAFNNAARAFNSALDALCDQLRSQLHKATIVYTDIYSIKYEIVSNYAKYGFASGLMACCGYGGPPYNYDRNIRCLLPGFKVCADGSKYISWDGVHYTDAANAIVASKILSAKYSKPPIRFRSLFS